MNPLKIEVSLVKDIFYVEVNCKAWFYIHLRKKDTKAFIKLSIFKSTMPTLNHLDKVTSQRCSTTPLCMLFENKFVDGLSL